MEIHGATAVAATLTTDELLELLYRRDIALAHHRSTVARTLRVTETELLALIHLVRRGDTAPSGLAERLDLSSGGATALVQRLVAGGHVTRHPHPADRRSTLLRVTPATARALADADASLLAGLDALVDRLSDEQRTTVAAFLGALAEGVEQLAAVQREGGGPGADTLERPVPSVWA